MSSVGTITYGPLWSSASAGLRNISLPSKKILVLSMPRRDGGGGLLVLQVLVHGPQ